MKRPNSYPKGLDMLQKISISLMAVLVLVTFVGANLHAVMWQSSSWLVSTVLPAVVVDLTNEEREDLNAPILQRNALLDEAARLKAQHMAQNEYFSHYSPDGVTPWHWFGQVDYTFAHAGENLAIHFTDSSEVVEAWMKSPTHRANIVDTKYAEIGVGTAKGTFDGYDTVYVVQLFGTPAVPVASVEPTPAPQTQDLELAAIEQSLNDLQEAVDDLAIEVEDSTEVVTEQPAQVLAETEDVPQQQSEEPVVIEDNDLITVEPDEAYLVTAEPVANEVLVVESTIATSSGLAVAQIDTTVQNQAGTTMISMATQPNQVLQLVYMLLGMVVMGLLLFSAVFEARKLHYMQVAYSFALMFTMGGLWLIHNLLTSGAVIV